MSRFSSWRISSPALLNATSAKDPPESRPPIPVEIGQSLAYSMLAAQIGSFLLILIVLPRRIGPDWKRQIGVRTPAGLHVFLVLLIVPGFMVVPGLIQEVYTRTDRYAAVPDGPGAQGRLSTRPDFHHVPGRGSWARPRRGALVPRVSRSRSLCPLWLGGGHPLDVACSSPLLHLDPSQLLVFTVMGAYLHFVYLATRSIWMPMLFHALNNSFAILAALYGVVEKLERQSARPGADPVSHLLSPLAFREHRALDEPGTDRVHPRRGGGLEEFAGWKPEYPGISSSSARGQE